MRTVAPAALAALLATACNPSEHRGPLPDADSGGGTDSGPDEVAPPEWCDGATAHRWDPWDADDVELFPDGLLEVPDPSTPTGRGIDLSVDRAPWVAELPPLLAPAVEAGEDLSGFGTQGAVLLRFTAPVSDAPVSVEESLDGPWMLVDLAAGERVPYQAEVLEDGLTVLIWPLRPLARGTRHAFVLTTEASADDGGCVAPADATRALLFGAEALDDPLMADAATRYRDAVEALGLRPDDISVITVYTTHDDVDVARQLAAEVPDHPVEWIGAPSCSDDGALLRCEARLTVLDHRNALGLIDAGVEPVEAEIPVTIWLPNREGGPWPVVVYGHGLGSRRSEGSLVAEAMGEDGYAVVAMEAVEHGDHPSASGGSSSDDAMRFLGIDLSTVSLDARAIRGNFDQTNLDRLRLVQLLKTHPDLDGDGIPELDADHIGYLGVSLGAVLGPQLLALSPDLEGGVLSVGGARLITIVTDTTQLADYIDLIAALVGSVERFDRLTAVAQHIVDPADGGTYAPHVLRDRWDGRPGIDLLLQVARDDEVVPRTSGYALARALDLPHMEPVVEPVELLQTIDADPVVGNLPDGGTAAFFQFDRVSRDGVVQNATHVATPKSDEGTLQMQHVLSTWVRGGPVEIVDPYEALGTPPLE
ncbi:MAG: hypothetical protein H6742_20375 [Alphaproteobacteria bacterium]|nr:hypothetical protein [Alphaproteobacteria bacterium]